MLNAFRMLSTSREIIKYALCLHAGVSAGPILSARNTEIRLQMDQFAEFLHMEYPVYFKEPL